MDLQQLFYSMEGQGSLSIQSILLTLTLAFVLGQMLAWVYYFTHSGLSYSKSYVQSIVLITVVIALVFAVIGNSIITAFGLMGALAIVRFRNILKDTRDLVFIFCALVIGMSCGAQRFGLAIVGSIILSLITIYLHACSFGSHKPFNSFLRFRCGSSVSPEHPLFNTLKQFCKNFTLVSVQDNGSGHQSEYAYQLLVKDYTQNEKMLYELEQCQDIENISLIMQEELLEA